MKRLASVVVAVILMATACGGTTSDTGAVAADTSSAADAAPAGDPLPEFSATTISGSQIDANDLKGSDTVLWFYAPW